MAIDWLARAGPRPLIMPVARVARHKEHAPHKYKGKEKKR